MHKFLRNLKVNGNYVGFKVLFLFLLGAAKRRLVVGKDFEMAPCGVLMMLTPISMKAWELMDEVLGF